jgi:ABC-type dipeptide/oligopeptide/nickel transport system permease subunit
MYMHDLGRSLLSALFIAAAISLAVGALATIVITKLMLGTAEPAKGLSTETA